MDVQFGLILMGDKAFSTIQVRNKICEEKHLSFTIQFQTPILTFDYSRFRVEYREPNNRETWHKAS